jgi:hypothetical protein
MKVYLALAFALCIPLLMYFGLKWPWLWAVIVWIISIAAIVIYGYTRSSVPSDELDVVEERSEREG